MPVLLAGRGLTRQTGLPVPSSAFVMSGGTIPAGMTFTRASPATYIDRRGFLSEAANNVPRFSYTPGIEYNLMPNPWFDGAVIGGSPPIGASLAGNTGLTLTTAGLGKLPDGRFYADLRVAGAPGSVGNAWLHLVSPAASPAIPAQAGNQFAAGWGTQLLSFAQVGNATIRAGLYGLTATDFSGDFTAGSFPLVAGAPLQEVAVVRTMTQPTTIGAGIGYQLQLLTAGSPIDLVVRVAFPTMTTGPTLITDRIPYATLMQRVGTTQQYGLRMLHLEEAATNLIRNPRFEGATPGVIGAGGVAPTNMTFVSGAGITYEILRVTTAGGFTVMDFTVTTTGAASPGLFLEALGGMPFSASTTYAHSLYVQVLSGTVANIAASTRMITDTVTPANGPTTPISDVTSLTRFVGSHTTAADATAGRMQLIMTAAGAATITLRIAAPQAEQGAYVSSPILPPVGAPAASTRVRDHVAIDSALLGTGPASYAMRAAIDPSFPAGFATARFLAQIGTGSEGPRVYTHSSNNTRVTLRRSAGDTMFNTVNGMLPGTPRTWAVAWGGGSGDFAEGGNAPVNDAAVSDPLAYAGAPLSIPDSPASALGAPVFLHFVRFWAGVRLTPAQLRAQSARLS